jgi:type II secretory pathway component GspD/PulD (secretin)
MTTHFSRTTSRAVHNVGIAKNCFAAVNLFVHHHAPEKTGVNTMKKTKILAVTLLAGFALHQLALCQTNATDASPTDAGAAATNPAASSMTEGTNQSVSITASNESTGIVVADTGGSNTPMTLSESNQPVSSVSTSNASPNMIASNTTIEVVSTSSQAVADTNTPAAATELPIQFQDVPITTAIESLARLAGINYLLDPKIGYGQPDQNGQIKPEPTLSIRWENVTAQQALLALLDNYGLQLIENPKTGIDKITTKDPSAPPPLITRVIQLKYASTSNMEIAVESTLTDKRSRVVPDARTSQLVVVATDPEQSAVDTMLNQLDKPTRQVLIETHLVELSSNPSTSKGIDWSGTLAAQNISFGNGILNAETPSSSQTLLPGTPATTTTTFGGHTITTTTTPGSSTLTTLNSEPQNSLSPGGLMLNTARGLTPDIGFLNADGVKAVLSFLNQSAEAQVVSTPRVVTLDNETATISVTRGYPVINVQAATTGVASGGSTITYSNIGTVLQVTPHITANDYIWLKVIPDVSSFFGTVTKSVAGEIFQADEFDSRHIETQVLIPNNHTLVMGGLVKDNPNAQYTKVPILGDIPVLGIAFRSENKSMDKGDLMIFITPTIVQDSDFKPSDTDFLGSQARTMKDPMNMHTWLDSAQPRGDWSNPIPPDLRVIDKTQNTNTDAVKVATP